MLAYVFTFHQEIRSNALGVSFLVSLKFARKRLEIKGGLNYLPSGVDFMEQNRTMISP